MLAVPRAFHRADYLPCILWGKIAAQAAGCAVGDRILLDGRLQSRIYTKLTEEGAEERTAYEISAMTAEFPAPEEQERIFHKFYQSDSSREVSGNGLGLSLARQIVAFSGGTVIVENLPEAGCRFTVSLPM